MGGNTLNKRDWVIIALIVIGPLADLMTTVIFSGPNIIEFNPRLKAMNKKELFGALITSHSIIVYFAFLFTFSCEKNSFTRHMISNCHI